MIRVILLLLLTPQAFGQEGPVFRHAAKTGSLCLATQP